MTENEANAYVNNYTQKADIPRVRRPSTVWFERPEFYEADFFHFYFTRKASV